MKVSASGFRPVVDVLSLSGCFGRFAPRSELLHTLPALGNLRESITCRAAMPYQPAADHRSGSTHSTPAVDVNGLSAVEGGVDGVEDRSHIPGSVRHVHIGNRPPFVADGDAPVPSFLVRKLDVGVQAFLRLRQGR